MTDKEYQEILTTTEEEWRQLILFHHLQDYDVSNLGRIRKRSTDKILKLSYNKEIKNCYRFITIKLHTGRNYNTEIHRLMAIMFIPVPKKYIKEGQSEYTLTIDHVDGVKYHNVLENLEWVTIAENSKRAIEMGLTTPDSGISYDAAHSVCQLLSEGYPIFTVAEDLNISEGIVANIRYKRSWKEVSKDYSFPTKQLTEASVRIICEYIARGYTNKQISELTHVTEGTIEHIRLRHTWTEISDDYTFPMKKINRTIAAHICRLLQDGLNPKEIADALDIGVRTVEHIRLGTTWKEVSKNYKFEYNKFKVADSVVHNICKALEKGGKILQDIADENGVSRTFVKDIKGRRLRKDISVNYKW